MRKISFAWKNQICMVGLFTQREPSHRSCWHWRDSVLLWLQKFSCAKALQPFLWGAQFSQTCGHQGRHWCPWDGGQIGQALICGGSEKLYWEILWDKPEAGYVGGIISVFIFTFKTLFWDHCECYVALYVLSLTFSKERDGSTMEIEVLTSNLWDVEQLR